MGGIRSLFGFDDLEHVPYGVAIGDVDGLIVDLNAACGRLLGRDRAEMRGQPWLEVVHADDRDRCREVLVALADGDAQVPTQRNRLLRSDGTAVWVDASFAPVRRDGALVALVVFVHDVTALVAAADQLDRALDIAIDGLWEWDLPQGRVTGNRRLTAMLGLPPDAPFPDAAEWQAMIHPDDAARVHVAFERLLTTDGTFHCEYRLRTARGELVIEDRSRVIERDADGRPIRVLGCVTDRTTQRAAEERLRHSQRMDALGHLAGGVAHDVNNMLTAIRGNAALLRRGSAVDADQLLADIELAVASAATLTRNLVAFGHRQPAPPAPIAVDQHVASISRLLKHVAGDQVRLVTQVVTPDASILFEAGALDQILVNLVANARDAMPRGGVVTITVDGHRDVAAPPPSWPDARPGPYVRIDVTDEGSGITDDIRDRLFEPFFTTKRRGSGTGLGLATVRGLVEPRGGFIEVESQLGRGTTFRVYLPQMVTVLPPKPASSSEWVRGSESIVVVDDDKLVRDTLARTLEMLGYDVTTYASGAACLGAAARVRHADLLITDAMMPGIDGCDLASRLRLTLPSLRVLLISGHADGHCGAGADMPFLAKPFATGELAKKVREVLAQGGDRGPVA
ncbi:MAG TPA: PAS domain-containing protein [Kofleriaceae bacterium]|nr:PAS domain-containing protein [Kofleriaceae bacterium]